MRRAQSLALAALLAGSPCHAHEDTKVYIRHDGSLSDIPAAYGPAALRIGFSRPGSDGPPVSSLELTLGRHKTSLPACVTGYFNTVRLADIRASASWYHEESLLPYYLSVWLLDPGHDGKSAYRSGYSLLFNLRTARLIRMEAQFALDGGKTMRAVPVDLADRCSPGELGRFKDASRP